MADKVLENIFSGGSIATLLFMFFVTYFTWDIIARMRKVDQIEKDIGSVLKNIQSEVSSVKDIVQGQSYTMARHGDDISELKSINKQYSHRLVAVETILKIQEMRKHGEIE